ncbi:hypothetical protein [Terriglobus tenax]|uniref:hypothetical protein n=1 Tax=Terriglobus tenax TaxID=1111115 RepID=UPI0021DF74D3|nr:hypothetical protein [Terriglobus tenax]
MKAGQDFIRYGARTEEEMAPGELDKGVPILPWPSPPQPDTHLFQSLQPQGKEKPEDQPELKLSAILVCHGMGQQVRYETISSVAQCLQQEAETSGHNTTNIQVRLFRQEEETLARAEFRWLDAAANTVHEVHVYEAYWAPLTEGRISFWETITFLTEAGLGGLMATRFGFRRTFQRWMFGDRVNLKATPWTWLWLLLILFLLGIVCLFITVALAAAAGWIKSLPLSGFPPLRPHQFWAWLQPMLPKSGKGFAQLAFLLGGAGVAAWLKNLIVQYAGDVAAYISPYKVSKFNEIRNQIRKTGIDVAKTIYGFTAQPPSVVPYYPNVLFVGHSLGSVVAYDTLNSAMNLDVLDPANQQDVLNRTRGLITFGSPLNKTAFLFRNQARRPDAWVREKIAAAMQPMIVDYSNRIFPWINLWSKMDIISGSLSYYDRGPVTVQNIQDPSAWIPIAAHTQYWEGKLLRSTLFSLL